MRSLLISIGLMLFVGGGCVRSVQPVLKDDQLIVNDEILGKWTEKGEDLVNVSRKGDEKQYELQYRDKEGKTGEFNLRLGKVGALTVAELTAQAPPGELNDVYKMHLLPLHSFAVLEQTNPQMVFSMFKWDWFKKYVDDHPNELSTVKLPQDQYIVTASTEDFQAFILKHWNDPQSRSDKSTYVRPNDAKPGAPPAEEIFRPKAP